MADLRFGGAIFITVFGCIAVTSSRDDTLRIGARCRSTEECHSMVPNSRCVYDGCFCLRSHYYDGHERRCKPVSPLGDPCSHDNHCGSPLMCQQGVCTCMPGYRQGRNACEPVGSLSDFESYGEQPVEKPNILVVVLEGLGLLALKVSLIYLFAKIMCVSCKRLARDATLQEVCSQDGYRSSKPSTVYLSGVLSYNSGFDPAAPMSEPQDPNVPNEALAPTVTSAVPLQTSFYPHRSLNTVYVQGSSGDRVPLERKMDYKIIAR